LQVLDDGRLTDSQGRTVDFKNTIIVMTSNVGSQKILKYKGSTIGEIYDRMKDEVMKDLREMFRPEFLNRVDDIIVFHALSEKHLKKIVDIQLNHLRERLAERKIEITLTDAAKEYLATRGYDASYGARPLKRTIQKEIETNLGKRILKGTIHDGMSVEIDYDLSRDELSFKPVLKAEVVE